METITQPDSAQTDMIQAANLVNDAVATDTATDTATNIATEIDMTGSALAAPITIALSRDELLVVLGALNVETIPGIDVEPTGDWTERERGIAQMVAVRSLRARELVQLNTEGEPQFHTDLLTAVGACAHSQSAAFVFHWPVRDSAPIRTFGHICGSDFVLHARLDDELHLFTLVPSKAEFLAQLLSLCGVEQGAGKSDDGLAEDSASDLKAAGNHAFRLSAAQFAEARSAATYEEVNQSLMDHGVEPVGASAFAETLVNAATQSPSDSQEPSRISILQTIQQTDEETVIKRDFTVLEDAEQRWLIAAESTLDETLPLLIKNATLDELLGLLDQWL